MKKIVVISIIVVLALIGFRFINTRMGEINREKMMQEASIPVVQLQEVNEIEISKSIEAPARIQSVDKVDLVARIDGYLQRKHFKEGDYVKKGQTLFTIEQTQYLNALNKAKADLESAKAQLYKTTRDYQRGAELVKKDFISKSTYDSLYADKLAAAASVKAASAALGEARRNYSYTTIKSPIDGKIGSLNIQEGNYVNAQMGTLATITKVNPIHVRYSIDSKDFERLKEDEFIPKKGQNPIKVEIIFSNGKTYSKPGIQDFLDNQISLTTGTIDFRATFENKEGELIPGDFVKVKVYSNKKSLALVVPQEMTLQDANGKYVYVVASDGTALQKYFKDNGQYENYWIVSEGLNKGDKFVSTNITKLMPKMPVKIAQNVEQKEQTPKEGEE